MSVTNVEKVEEEAILDAYVFFTKLSKKLVDFSLFYHRIFLSV